MPRFVPETLKLGLAPKADAAGGTGSMQLFNKGEMERKKVAAHKSGEGQTRKSVRELQD